MNISEFTNILNNFENDDLEFRLLLGGNDDKHRSAKTAVAFCNTRGGKIIFGVKEDGKKREVIGLDNPQMTESNITSQIRGTTDVFNNMNFEFIKYKGKDVLIVNFLKGERPPYKYKDNILIRKGSNNVDPSEEEIAKMYRDRSTESYDRSIVKGASLEDINLEDTSIYLEGLNVLGEVSDQRDDLRVLSNMGILKKIDNNYVPTIAGILLFGKKPQNFFPSAVIRADVKNHDSDNWVELKDIGGTIINQIEECEKFIHKHIKEIVRIVGFKRVNEHQFSIKNLREVVVNAIAHRDYGDRSASIHFQIRKNMVRTTNPGGIISPLTLETVLSGHFVPRTRNEVIATEILRKGFMERRGSGIYSIICSMKKRGLPEPKFQDVDSNFIVDFFAPIYKEEPEKIIIPENTWTDADIDKDMEKILAVIQEKKEARLKDFEEALKKTRGSFGKKLDYLLDKDFIERFPSKPIKSPKAYYAIHHRFTEVPKVDSTPENESNFKGQMKLGGLIFK